MRAEDSWLLAIVVVAVVAIAVLGCHDGCAPGKTKCSGNRVEICNADEDWELLLNCSNVEPSDMGWQCCFEGEYGDHGCVPGGCGGDQ